ncbi:DUF4145 domain-containing protein [Cryobacterium sp. PAMC25264]|uniref:DUF4145 domain-containing protein n=1 Tax=Cryobacterium sp. PAMC25264 TaxID=2861288 RepID=UPI001C62C319|nr:DUF4145 domain-containing protein [Cryobacterium sp. PAMC25264]QYF74139.1 DUF4145 domain-containing protein [Cryobacterium sp. PAMC25264]
MASQIPAAERTPQWGRAAFDCPRCNTYAKHTREKLSWDTFTGPVEVFDEKRARIVNGVKRQLPAGFWSSAQCSACENYSIWRDEVLIYPRASGISSPASDMPAGVADLYNEAREVMAVSRRAGAALARATLERLLKTLDDTPPKNANLAARIDAVHGKVSSSLGEMLTVIRHVGNQALHGSETTDDSVLLILDETQTELVDLIFESINELVDELVTKPEASKRFLSLVPQGC